MEGDSRLQDQEILVRQKQYQQKIDKLEILVRQEVSKTERIYQQKIDKLAGEKDDLALEKKRLEVGSEQQWRDRDFSKTQF